MLPALILSTLARYHAAFLAATVYAWMQALTSAAPWADTYGSTAAAIAEAATAHPLWPGEDGPRRTAALLVAVAKFESEMDPNAVGDAGQSRGMYQIDTSHAPAAELTDPRAASEVAIRLLRDSMWICRTRPEAERLAWFAHGGVGCPSDERSGRLSRHRWGLAEKLLTGR